MASKFSYLYLGMEIETADENGSACCASLAALRRHKDDTKKRGRSNCDLLRAETEI